MSWIKGSATGHLALSDALVAAATGNSVATVGINNAGTGYTVGDVLSVVGGTGTVVAQIEVTSVSTGVITGIRRYNDGVYTVNPSSPNSVTGGTGASASITLTFAANGWTVERDTTWSGAQKEVILSGVGGGTDSIYVGWRTLTNSSTYWNWELHGMTGYNAALPINEQPGCSQGDHEAALATSRSGAYLLLFDVAIPYWFHITPYRIVIIAKVSTSYNNAYLGWGTRFGTEAEYPYPMIVAGHCSGYNVPYNSGVLTAGLIDPYRCQAGEGTISGPMFVLYVDGWHSVANETTGMLSTAATRIAVVVPCGITGARSSDAPVPEPKDLFFNSVAAFSDLVPSSGAVTTATALLDDTPGTIALRMMFPSFIVFFGEAHVVVAELTGVYWTSGQSSVVNENRVIIGSDVYRLFQNGNRTTSYSFLAVKEN